MSVEEALAVRGSGNESRRNVEKKKDMVKKKRRGYDRCLSFPCVDIKIEPAGASSLKEVDSVKLKKEIKKWAKNIARYARQVSGQFGAGYRGTRG